MRTIIISPNFVLVLLKFINIILFSQLVSQQNRLLHFMPVIFSTRFVIKFTKSSMRLNFFKICQLHLVGNIQKEKGAKHCYEFCVHYFSFSNMRFVQNEHDNFLNLI